MSEKCPKCNRAAEYYIPSEGSRPTPGACYLTDGEDCLRRQLAHAKRELEQSRQREAAAVAKLADIDLWTRNPADTRSLHDILDGTPEVLAVVEGRWFDGTDDEYESIELNPWLDQFDGEERQELIDASCAVRVIVLLRDERGR